MIQRNHSGPSNFQNRFRHHGWILGEERLVTWGRWDVFRINCFSDDARVAIFDTIRTELCKDFAPYYWAFVLKHLFRKIIRIGGLLSTMHHNEWISYLKYGFKRVLSCWRIYGNKSSFCLDLISIVTKVSSKIQIRLWSWVQSAVQMAIVWIYLIKAVPQIFVDAIVLAYSGVLEVDVVSDIFENRESGVHRSPSTRGLRGFCIEGRLGLWGLQSNVFLRTQVILLC